MIQILRPALFRYNSQFICQQLVFVKKDVQKEFMSLSSWYAKVICQLNGNNLRAWSRYFSVRKDTKDRYFKAM